MGALARARAARRVRARAMREAEGSGGPRGGLVLRAATASDLPQVAAIERAAFSDPWAPVAFERLLNDPRVLFLVAVSPDDHVLGYVVAWFVLDEGEIGNLAVADAARRRGVGGTLLDAALEAAHARGVDVVYLEVRDSNAAARALYAARGFEVVARRPRYYRRPVEDALVLRCDVAPR